MHRVSYRVVSQAALDNAAQVKKEAEKAVEMESEDVQRLSDTRLTWAGGPIFDKMKKLCKLDYAAFKKVAQWLSQLLDSDADTCTD